MPITFMGEWQRREVSFRIRGASVSPASELQR
jgi:hypothetical protein